MATLDNIQPHQISLWSRVILESPRARMLSQYLCDTKTSDLVDKVHKVQIRDPNGEMHHVQAVIDYGATSIRMVPRLLKQLKILHDAAHITTLGLDREVIQHAKDRRKTQVITSVSNGSGLPGCSAGLEPDRMVQSGLLPAKQEYPPGSRTGWNRTAVPFYGVYNFASN